LIIDYLEYSLERIDIAKLVMRTFISTGVEVRAEVDQRLEIFENPALVTPVREILETPQRDELVARCNMCVLRVNYFHSDFHYIVTDSQRHHKFLLSFPILKQVFDNVILIMRDCFTIACAQRSQQLD
jgi:hypothetical protein